MRADPRAFLRPAASIAPLSAPAPETQGVVPREEDRRFLARGTWLNLIGLVSKNISPVLVVLMARVLPREAFGLFVSLQMLILTASRLTVLGFDGGLVWFVSQNERRGIPAGSGVGAALRLTLASAGILAVGTAGWIAFGNGLPFLLEGQTLPDSRAASMAFALLCVATLVPYMPLHGLAAALEGAGRPEYKIYVNYSLVTTLTPALAILLHSLGFGLPGLALGFFASHAVGALVLFVYARRHLPALRLFGGGERVDRDLLRLSLPLGIAETISGLVRRIDLWMVLAMLGAGEAGAYAVMLVLSNGLRSVREGYHPLIVRVVSRMEEHERAARLRPTFSYAVNVVTAIQLVVATVVLFVPDLILSIAGRQYVIDPRALGVLLVGNLVHGFVGLSDQVVVGMGKSRPQLVANVVALAINAAFNAWWIPRYGLSGAAAATVVANLVYGLMMYRVQFALTNCHLFESHLAINGMLVALFGVAVFAWQAKLAALDLGVRLGGCAVALTVVVAIFYAKRRTFSPR